MRTFIFCLALSLSFYCVLDFVYWLVTNPGNHAAIQTAAVFASLLFFIALLLHLDKKK